jgi:hypothetical protein
MTMYELKKTNQTPENENSEMCQARECPNRWTVDKGQRLCSAHAWADFKDWDRITSKEWQIYRERGDRNNYQAMTMENPVNARPVSQAEKFGILKNLRDLMRNKNA